MRKFLRSTTGFLLFFIAFSLFFPSKISAHCDTLDGPVVNAARKALDSENANYVLIWVKPEDEDQIRTALKKAREKRKNAKNKKEKDKADMEFFEKLVKVHREGEGAKYEGIKPAGSIEKEIALADECVETGNVDAILSLIKSPENRKIITHLFHKTRQKSHYSVDDVSEGREFIESYVVFIHSVEKAMKGEILDIHHLHEHE